MVCNTHTHTHNDVCVTTERRGLEKKKKDFDYVYRGFTESILPEGGMGLVALLWLY